MDNAARDGNINTLKSLHKNNYKCTKKAMDLAAENGHLSVVKWLNSHRIEGCTTNAIALAARNGHLDIVMWLHENRKEGCTDRCNEMHCVRGS